MSESMNFLRSQVMDPLYCFLTRSPKLRYWRELERTQYLPHARLLEVQWQRLAELLSFAWEHNCFYRQRFERSGVTPQDIHSAEDLHRLPMLTKTEVRRHATEMISRGFSSARLQKAKTGGSTGKALKLYFTEECSELRNACARRHDRWAGWEVGEPVAAVWGNPLVPATCKAKLKNALLQPVIYLDTMSVTEEAVRVFAREWDRVRPTLLFGHAHSIFLLARYVRQLRLDGIRPNGILSTSMMLLPNERQAIEEQFGVKVTDRYGCEEVSLIASECEKHEGLHLNIEHLYVEFLREDGTPAAAGEPGRVVVTDLINLAMPLIRYQVEDVGVPSNRTCSCGRGLPMMEQVTGRVADFLVKRDGTQVAGVSLIENTLTSFPGLDQMQIIQKGYHDFQLKVVTGDGFSLGVSADLVRYIKSIFGADVNVAVTPVQSISAEKSGKYRFSICEMR